MLCELGNINLNFLARKRGKKSHVKPVPNKSAISKTLFHIWHYTWIEAHFYADSKSENRIEIG